MNKIHLKNLLDQSFEPMGMSSVKNGWIRRLNDNVVFVIGLQKSNWGDEYYLNCGAVFSVVIVKNLPALDKWQIYGRLSYGDTHDAVRIQELLDFERPMDEQSRLSELVMLCTGRLLVLWEIFADIDKARVYFTTTRHFLLTQLAHDYYGLD